MYFTLQFVRLAHLEFPPTAHTWGRLPGSRIVDQPAGHAFSTAGTGASMGGDSIKKYKKTNVGWVHRRIYLSAAPQ